MDTSKLAISEVDRLLDKEGDLGGMVLAQQPFLRIKTGQTMEVKLPEEAPEKPVSPAEYRRKSKALRRAIKIGRKAGKSFLDKPG